MTTEQPERERMSRAGFFIQIEGEDAADMSIVEDRNDSSFNHIVFECERVKQLQADLAAECERAEKFRKLAKEAIQIRDEFCKERDTLRTQLTLAEQQRDAAVEALIEMEDVGIASMTLLEGSNLHRKMDEAVDKARNTLTRIRELGDREAFDD